MRSSMSIVNLYHPRFSLCLSLHCRSGFRDSNGRLHWCLIGRSSGNGENRMDELETDGRDDDIVIRREKKRPDYQF